MKKKHSLSVIALAAVVLLVASARAAGEEDYLKNVREFISKGDLLSAVRLVEKEGDSYSGSLDAALTKIEVYEKFGVSAQRLSSVYAAVEKVFEGKKPDRKQAKILKAIEAKRRKLDYYREKVDEVLEEFREDAEHQFKNLLASNKVNAGAYVYERLALTGIDDDKKNELLSRFPEGDFPDVARYEAYPAPTEAAIKLLDEAGAALKDKDLKIAREKVARAVKAAPHALETIEMQFRLALKDMEHEDVILHGLRYLLAPPGVVRAEVAEAVEDEVLSERPSLKKLFKSSEKAADKLLKIAKAARSKKRFGDYNDVVETASGIYHSTSEFEKFFSDPAVASGDSLFNPDKFPGSAWTNDPNIESLLGSMVIEPGSYNIFSDCETATTSGDFRLTLSLAVGPVKEAAGDKDRSAGLLIKFWRGSSDSALMAIYAAQGKKGNPSINLNRLSSNAVQKEGEIAKNFSRGILAPLRWYVLTLDYDHEHGCLNVFLDGERAATMLIPEKFMENARTGGISIGCQHYRYVKVRSVHLRP